MVRHVLKILQHLLEDFQSVPDHFEILCIKGLRNNFAFVSRRNGDQTDQCLRN